MSSNDDHGPSKPSDDALLDDLRGSLEALRSKIIDLEAVAHAAAEFMDRVPYLPRQPRQQPAAKPEWTGEERRNLGRIQSLVFATAAAAGLVLDEINGLIDDAYVKGGSEESGSGEGGGSGGPSAPDGGGSGENDDGSGGPSAQDGPENEPGGSGGSGGSGSDGSPRGPNGAPERTGGNPRGPNGITLRAGGIALDLRPTPPSLV